MVDIPQNSLFRFRMPCRRLPGGFQRSKLQPETLGKEYSFPIWSQGERRGNFNRAVEPAPGLVGKQPRNEELFDIRTAWSQEGFAITVVTARKRSQSCWTRSNLSSADALRICLDTRDIKDSQRAGRFCHKFYFYPLIGETLEIARPLALWVPINRAKAFPNSIDVGDFTLASEARADGLAFSAFIPSGSLTGYDPSEFRRLGIHFEYRDSENGSFVLQFAEPFPIEDNPSLWATLDLVEAKF